MATWLFNTLSLHLEHLNSYYIYHKIFQMEWQLGCCNNKLPFHLQNLNSYYIYHKISQMEWQLGCCNKWPFHSENLNS